MRNGIVILCIIIIVPSALWTALRPSCYYKINHEGYRSIVKGMTLFDVEAALEARAGDYSTRRVEFLPLGNPPCALGFEQNHRVWTSNDARIHVFFDDQWRVERACEQSAIEYNESLWTRIRARLDV